MVSPIQIKQRDGIAMGFYYESESEFFNRCSLLVWTGKYEDEPQIVDDSHGDSEGLRGRNSLVRLRERLHLRKHVW